MLACLPPAAPCPALPSLALPFLPARSAYLSICLLVGLLICLLTYLLSC